MLLSCFCVSAVSLFAACDRSSGAASSTKRSQRVSTNESRQRQIVARNWDTVSTIGGNISDTTIISGNEVLLRGDTLIVADAGGRRIVAYDTMGRLLWTFGRSGAGPGEFRQITDLSMENAGRVLVLDALNRRVTSYNPWDGTFTETSLREIGRPTQLIGLRKGAYLISTMSSPDTQFAIIDTLGNVLEQRSHAWPGLASVHPMAAQLWLSRASQGDWVAAFSLASGFVAYDSVLTPLVRATYVDVVEFPRVRVTREGETEIREFADYAGCTACSIATDSEKLFVVAGTDPDHRSRWIDVFALADGSYHGSYLLPEPARAIAVNEDTFFVLRNEPAPGILVLKPRS